LWITWNGETRFFLSSWTLLTVYLCLSLCAVVWLELLFRAGEKVAEVCPMENTWMFKMMYVVVTASLWNDIIRVIFLVKNIVGFSFELFQERHLLKLLILRFYICLRYDIIRSFLQDDIVPIFMAFSQYDKCEWLMEILRFIVYISVTMNLRKSMGLEGGIN